MRVLLLNPPGPFCRAGSRWPHGRALKKTGIDYHPFPFQLAYATSRLLEDGHDAKLVDCIATSVSLDQLESIAREFNPDVVFMETSAPSWAHDLETFRRLGRRTIAGGAHATATAKEHLEAGFDAVIRGEYDQVISDAVQLLPQPWLATAEQPEAGYTPLIRDLDAIPRPAWHQMSMEKYNDPFCMGLSVTVLTSRGCPLECGFCTIAPFEGKRNYRRREPKDVCDEIATLISLYQPDEIYFDDDTITVNRKHAIALSEEYASRGFGIPFSCMGNAVIEPDVIAAMARAGCRAIKFGVESADPEVLRQIPKDQRPEDVVRTVNDCRAHGIQTHANFLVGLPGETRESALRTIDFALRLNTHTLQFAIATPYPGTAFYERAKQNGWLTKESWMQFDPSGEAVVSYPGYTADDIAAMYDHAWRRWQWHMMTTRPRTVLHHFGNAYRREGLGGMMRLGKYSAQRLLKVVGAHG
ncbi:MAG TPA: radical SAM protein [Candidatus Hydrogenedentes bacterium]|nr:radical SAM protein [Candidatus Hydrogenedentota bacterium]HRK34912.1 radical SAM protein [Candidatus Hydrogenedentota bacterium]